MPNIKFAGKMKKYDEGSTHSELIEKLSERFDTKFDPATDEGESTEYAKHRQQYGNKKSDSH